MFFLWFSHGETIYPDHHNDFPSSELRTMDFRSASMYGFIWPAAGRGSAEKKNIDDMIINSNSI